MDTIAVLLRGPEDLGLERLDLTPPGRGRCRRRRRVERHQHRHRAAALVRPHAALPGHGVSAGPRLRIGRPRDAGRAGCGPPVGERVFVPGARCFGPRARVVRRRRRPAGRARRQGGAGRDSLGEHGVLLALAATAYHATRAGAPQPELIIGHGVLGRLLARLAIAAGAPPPTVWESNPGRRDGAEGYRVVDPASDDRRDYRAICDVCGDPKLLDTLIGRLAPGRRDRARRLLRRAAQLRLPARLHARGAAAHRRRVEGARPAAVQALIAAGRLSLDGLITHAADAARCRRMPTARPSPMRAA